ncbi:MAG: CPXCG motif-containing cysteine-rich protein [Calditrichaeota bacterium]|nr:CPXCG motif-containing cysteine-rich protein [Calditrichota bacterium]
MEDVKQILCPYCGQPNEVFIDVSGGRVQRYVEDCQICCRPWQVHVEIVAGEPVVTLKTSDE